MQRSFANAAALRLVSLLPNNPIYRHGTKRKRAVAKQQPSFFAVLTVAAATEENDKSNDDNPGAVIVEDVAKAVVVHIDTSYKF